ncbi:MAG: MMPL family transporter [Kangiellaceae bacterium]|nr:MMPL family transporter [Kangiellaceae bacterium]
MKLTAFANWVVSRPWKTILACLVFVVSMGYFMKDVAPSISYKDLLGADYPHLKTYERIHSEFTSDENLLVLIEAKKGTVLSAEIIAGVRQLTTDLWQTPYSVRVDSLTNFQHTSANNDELIVDSLVPDDAVLTDEYLQKVKSISLAEPQLLNRAINPDAEVLALSVSFLFPAKDMNEKLQANDFVEKLVNEFGQRLPQTNTYISGLVALDATVMKISSKETGVFLLAIILVVAILMWVLFRAVKPALITVVIILFSVITGMAFSGLMGWKLTPFTASVPLMILVLATADCIHFISSVMESISKGMDKKEAIKKSLTLNFSPLAITSMTTAIGFMTLNFSESESIGALGTQVAFGVMVAFLLAVTFLPACLSVMKLTIKMKAERKNIQSQRFAKVIADNKLAIAVVGFILFGALATFVPDNEFNDNIPTYFAKTLPWRQANDFAEKEFGGAYTFSYVFRSREINGVVSPHYLQQIEKFSLWLKSRDDVASVSSFSDVIKRINKSMHNDDPSSYQLPEDKELISQYLLLYEMSLPFGLDLNNQLNFDKSASKTVATFRTLSTSQILELEQEIEQWVSSNLTGVDFEATGVQLMFAHLLDKDTRGLVLGAGFGLVIISLLLIVAFRSFTLGGISLIPNLMPVIIGFGLWGMLVGQVGMGMAMVSGITIGIVVDDTVHFLHKYLVARNLNGFTPQQSIQYAYQHAGRAILFTTLILVSGFMLMVLLSEFRVNTDMGKMACIVMVSALVVDLLFLPALILLFDREKEMVEDANGGKVTEVTKVN